MKLELGVAYDLPPIPYEPDHTKFFDAGSLRVGVEYRVLDEAVVTAAFTEDQRSHSSIDQVKEGAMPDTDGVSLHVCDEAGLEYLRFDCFSDDPHYHYIWPGQNNLAVPYDVTANGDMLQWSLDRLTDRLSEMLNVCAPSVAARADADAVRSILPDVQAYAEAVRRSHVTAGS